MPEYLIEVVIHTHSQLKSRDDDKDQRLDEIADLVFAIRSLERRPTDGEPRPRLLDGHTTLVLRGWTELAYS